MAVYSDVKVLRESFFGAIRIFISELPFVITSVNLKFLNFNISLIFKVLATIYCNIDREDDHILGETNGYFCFSS
jgi:hypothetical protein